MSKAPKTEPNNKPDILHLLEYCRIDRAAELLGCEVCDLLHLEEIGSITLYWHFKYQPATIMPSDENAEADEGVVVHAFVAPVNEEGKYPNSQEDTPALISGLWRADDRLTKPLSDLWSQNSSLRNNSVCMALTPCGEQAAILPEEWQEPPESELFITRHDMQRIQEAIYSKMPLGPRDWPYDEPQHQYQSVKWMELNERRRTTDKQCRALMAAFLLAGLSEDDINGNPEKLQDKVLALAEQRGIKDPRIKAITECQLKTLTTWIARGSQ